MAYCRLLRRWTGGAVALFIAAPCLAQSSICTRNGPFLNCHSEDGSYTTCSAIGAAVNCNTVGGNVATMVQETRPRSAEGRSASGGTLTGFLQEMRARRLQSRVGKALKAGDCTTAVREASGSGDIDYATKVQALCARLAAPTSSSAASANSPIGCVDLAGANIKMTAEGKLTLRSFAGPPNYRSVDTGDAEARVFILELAQPACVVGSGNAATTRWPVSTIHVASANHVVLNALRKLVGRQVVIDGDGFAAHTGHHRAPIVMMTENVIAR